MYIAYVYKPDGSILSQIHDISDVEFSERLNTSGAGSFFLKASNTSNTAEVLQEFNIVNIGKVSSSGETVLFYGYIKAVIAESEGTQVEIGDMNDFLKSKYIAADKTYTGKTLDFIVSEIISEMNTRYDSGITVDCGVTDIIPDKTYSQGKDILGVLEDLSTSGYEFLLQDGVLKVKAEIGIDRTVSGVDFLEFIFDVDNPSTRSIENPKSTFNSENIANSIILKGDNGTQTDSDATSITKYGRVERFFSNSGVDAATAAEVLQERKDSIREISFTPIVGSYDAVGVGDTVQVLINTKNTLSNFIGSAKVVEKSITSGDLDDIQIKVSTSKVKTLSFVEQIEKLKKSQKNLEL